MNKTLSGIPFTFLIPLLTLFFFSNASGQSLPIALDGKFADWQNAASLADPSNDGAGINFLELQVSNDERYLYLRLRVENEFRLNAFNAMSILLDTDNDAGTGDPFNGIGADLRIFTGDLQAKFIVAGNASWHNLNDIGYISQPTVSANEFEIAIERLIKPDGVHAAIPGNALKIVISDSGGDRMPNSGQTFTYEMDDTPVPAYEPIPLEKQSPEHLRLMTWNTLSDGMLENSRKEHFQRVLAAVQPDVVTFNECWDMTAGQAATFMNVAVPLANSASWKAARLFDGNITVSRFPIAQNWEIDPGVRLLASLINLPDDIYPKDLLVINGHLKCCEADGIRQAETDAFVKFMLDAKSPGGVIDLPENTPFILSGDLNLVGDRQPLTTLLNGEIVNTSQFGNGGDLDWDGSPLEDQIALQADERMAFTWFDFSSDYPPSRLDYAIFSNSVMSAQHAYVLRTESMSEERLNAYGLQPDDTGSASDHFPKVTDFDLINLVGANENLTEAIDFQVFPNPAGEMAYLKMPLAAGEQVKFFITDISGKKLLETVFENTSEGEIRQMDLNGLPVGVLIFCLQSEAGFFSKLVVKSMGKR